MNNLDQAIQEALRFGHAELAMWIMQLKHELEAGQL